MLPLILFSALVASTSAGSTDAVVGIVPGSNSYISGTIYFSKHPYGVLISGTVKGLSPGQHGFHIHERGDTSDGCKAAGGHFNPLQRTHGSPQDFQRHVGDLGNIKADERGLARIDYLDTHISLDRESPAYIGDLAVVIHAGVDDLGRGGNDGSLKTGNAGGRDGCGLIHVVNRPDFMPPFHQPLRQHHPSSRLSNNYFQPLFYHFK